MLRSHCWKFPCPLSLTGSAGPARNLTTDASSSISPEVQAAMRSVPPLGQPTFKSMLPTPPLGPLPPAPVPGAWQPPRPAAAQPAPEVAAEEAAPAQDAGAAGWDGGDMPLPAAEAEAGAEAAEQEYEPYPQPGMGEPGEGWGGGELDAEGGAAVQPHMEQYGEAAAQQYDGQQYGGDWGAAGGWGSGEGDAEGGAAAAAAEYGAEAGAEQYQQQDQGYYSQEYYAQGYAGGEEGGYAGQVRQAREVCDGTRADSRHKSRLQHSKTMPCRIHTSTEHVLPLLLCFLLQEAANGGTEEPYSQEAAGEAAPPAADLAVADELAHVAEALPPPPVPVAAAPKPPPGALPPPPSVWAPPGAAPFIYMRGRCCAVVWQVGSVPLQNHLHMRSHLLTRWPAPLTFALQACSR